MSNEATSGDILEIHTVGDPVLRRKAKPVRHVNRTLDDLIDRMIKTMYAADGVGLAAPQVGVGKRLIVIDAGQGPVVLVNPEITAAEGEELGTEGCLSVPGKAGEVKRATRVKATGLDRDGRQVWHEAEGLFARALQHEIDHLDGVLFIDRAVRVWEVPPEQSLRIVFMGTPEFAVPILNRLVRAGCAPVAVVTRPDRPRGRGNRLEPSPVKEAALRHNLPVLTPERMGDPEFMARLTELAPDVIVTAAYGRILPRAVLDLPRLACLNVHPSPLPSYRGPAPILRALMNGDEKTGVAIMHMAEEVDAGDVLLQQEVAIQPEEDRGALEARLATVAGGLLLRALRLVAIGEAPRRPQDHDRATYAPALTRAEEFIDWSRPAAVVVHQVRALAPRPGASTAVGERPLKILRAGVVPLPPEADGDLPGQVVALLHDEGFVVAAGDGAVLVREVKPAAGRTMAAADFLRGNPLRPGDVLGATPADPARDEAAAGEAGQR